MPISWLISLDPRSIFDFRAQIRSELGKEQDRIFMGDEFINRYLWTMDSLYRDFQRSGTDQIIYLKSEPSLFFSFGEHIGFHLASASILPEDHLYMRNRIHQGAQLDLQGIDVTDHASKYPGT